MSCDPDMNTATVTIPRRRREGFVVECCTPHEDLGMSRNEQAFDMS